MKKVLLFVYVLFSALKANSQWTELNYLNGRQLFSEVPKEKRATVSFVIGQNLYYGMGYTANVQAVQYDTDVKKFDPVTNMWTAVSDFSTVGRGDAFTFSYNNSGYVIMGNDFSTEYLETWMYDYSTNLWTQKADFPGAFRKFGYSFVIDGKFYMGGGIGQTSAIIYSDLWEYDPAADSWTQKTSMPGGGVYNSVSYASRLTGSGYVIAGFDSTFSWRDSVYKYDQLSDSWSPMQSVPSPIATANRCFSSDSGAYVMTSTSAYLDTYFYDETSDTWTLKDHTPDFFSFMETLLPVNNDGYAILSNGDVWKYDTSTDEWINVFHAPSSPPNIIPAPAVINDTAYFNSVKYSILTDTWVADPLLDNMSWKFVINNHAYGIDLGGDLQEFDPATHAFTLKSRPPFDAASFFAAVNNLAYAGGYAMDSTLTMTYQFWQYDPVTDVWSRNPDLPCGNIEGVVTFSIGTKLYLATGSNENGMATDEFWEYETTTGIWNQLAAVPGGVRMSASGTSVDGKGIVVLGITDAVGVDLCDIQQYDPVLNTWTEIIHPLECRHGTICFTSYDNLYIGGGVHRISMSDSKDYYDLWKYDGLANDIADETETNFTTVYPNPVSGILNMKNDAGENYLITDIAGRVVLKGKLPVNVSEIQAGIYTIRSVEGKISERFIIQH